MRLLKDVKAETVAFPVDGVPVNGLYQVGSEMLVLVQITDETFYAFRGQYGTAAREHLAGSVMVLVRAGEML
jgi:hypothetical protein